jgi:hypothetical protein
MRRRCKLGASEGYHSLFVLPVNTPLAGRSHAVPTTAPWWSRARSQAASVHPGVAGPSGRAPWRRRPVGARSHARVTRPVTGPRPPPAVTEAAQAGPLSSIMMAVGSAGMLAMSRLPLTDAAVP